MDATLTVIAHIANYVNQAEMPFSTTKNRLRSKVQHGRYFEVLDLRDVRRDDFHLSLVPFAIPVSQIIDPAPQQ